MLSSINLTVDDLLAGASVDYEIAVPTNILSPANETNVKSKDKDKEMVVKLKPITIGVFQLILKAARSDSSLIPLLMIKESVIDPELNLEQVKNMHVGLITYLVENIREISGLSEKKN